MLSNYNERNGTLQCSSLLGIYFRLFRKFFLPSLAFFGLAFAFSHFLYTVSLDHPPLSSPLPPPPRPQTWELNWIPVFFFSWWWWEGCLSDSSWILLPQSSGDSRRGRLSNHRTKIIKEDHARFTVAEMRSARLFPHRDRNKDNQRRPCLIYCRWNGLRPPFPRRERTIERELVRQRSVWREANVASMECRQQQYKKHGWTRYCSSMYRMAIFPSL